MRKICDANIILRYLLHDDEDLYNKANEIVLTHPQIPLLVLSEVIYVLKSVYKISRQEIAESLILLSDEIVFEDNEITIKAINNFKEINMDFVDCYLLARNQICDDDIVTFDKKLHDKLI